MKNINTYLTSRTALFVYGFILCLIICRPWVDELNLTPVRTVQEIKQEVKQVVVVADTKIDSFVKVNKLLSGEARTLKDKLLLAQAESKRLKLIKVAPTETYSELPTDCTEISNAAAYSDSVCNEVINVLHEQIINTDSISFQKDVKILALNKGFEDMTTNSIQKDAAIKSINKKLKWQKIQNVGLKGLFIGAAILIVKNSL